MLGNYAEAEDNAQEVFLKTFHNLQKYTLGLTAFVGMMLMASTGYAAVQYRIWSFAFARVDMGIREPRQK
ncbi:hypothetical protein J23TS9_14010 [Paenibacillus sp. J23TS9]|nr:hypothetical protein J23TS9_14010 [Paenibacillus sp. J23TS9]